MLVGSVAGVERHPVFDVQVCSTNRLGQVEGKAINIKKLTG